MNQITREDVNSRLRQALALLIERDACLFSHDLHEGTITHKLGEYLQPLFPDFNVECEYDRDGHDPKRVNLPPAPDPGPDEGSNICPDIIIHNRGDNDHNLIVVEAKKSSWPNRGVSGRDRMKIEGPYRELGYQFGAGVTFLMGGHEQSPFELHVFSRGEWD